MGKALELKKVFEKQGKEVFIFAANEIKPDYFTGYGIDAWVNTGCPRIAEDRFERPVIDMSELA
jgi:diphthamide biosynthesis enzyme Dph1/Dph2-like protein